MQTRTARRNIRTFHEFGKGDANVYQLIIDAMQELGDSGLTFGVENSREGEKQLQNALGAKLERLTGPDGWSWRYQAKKEEKFKTKALTNNGTIAVDLVGRHPIEGMVAVELKYVAINSKSGKPQDVYAFPWDVAKDCLKLDLLRAGLCQRAKNGGALPDRTSLQTYAIAMTNWSSFWEGRKEFAWASEFLAGMQASSARFESLIKTTGPTDKTIFYHKRHHIAFGQPWTGEWRPYAEQFRYMFLRPAFDGTPQWTHHQDRPVNEQSKIIPFLNDEARQEWSRQYDACKNAEPT